MKGLRSKATARRRTIRRTPRRRRRIRQTLNRLHVVAVRTNAASTPHNTTGWTATIEQTGAADQTVNFDNTGVARFPQIPTLTANATRLTIENAAGDTLFERNFAAGREVIVARFTI